MGKDSKRARCVECDIMYDGDFDKHCKSKRHIENTEVNYILRIMEGMGINPVSFYHIVNERGEETNHGKLVL